jgi:hypothetical protein
MLKRIEMAKKKQETRIRNEDDSHRIVETKKMIAFDGHYVINRDCARLDDWIYDNGWLHRVNPSEHSHVIQDTMLFWIEPLGTFIVYCHSPKDIKYYHSKLREQSIFVGPAECVDPSTSIPPLLVKLGISI